MHKRGQFFLIAGLIIVIMIFGVTAIYNSVRVNPPETQIYDLSEEIDFESAQVIENAVYKGTQTEVQGKLKSLIETYGQQNPESDIFVIYGDSSEDLTFMGYADENSGTVGVGESEFQIIERKIIVKEDIIKNNNGEVTIKLNNVDYTFDTTEGQNFYIVLKKDKDDETYIAQK